MLRRIAIGLALLAAMSPARACGTDPLGEARVAGLADSRTLTLDDGRLIRLAGIEWAVPPDAAKAELADLVLNRSVTLKGAKTADRYGRQHAFPIVSGSETPIQYVLLERGLAVVGTRIGEKACLEALRSREQAARAARLGVWTAEVKRADAPNVVLRDRGRFAIVEGRVVSVRESGSTIYVNFGRRWSEDFTVTIAKRNEPTFISAGLPPRQLSGRNVRVRGVIEERAGPWIEATRPEQFEVMAVGTTARDKGR